MNNFFYINIKNEKNGCNRIRIETAGYPNEEVNSAIDKITEFCAKTDIAMETDRGGYGTIRIKIGNNDEKMFGFSAYGLHIKKMLAYIEECEPLIAAGNQGSSDNRYSQFYHAFSPLNNENRQCSSLSTSCILQ